MGVGRLGLRRTIALLAIVAGTSAVASDRSFEPVPVRDPYYGQILFDFYQEHYFDSIVQTLAASSADRLPNHADDAELLLGGLFLSYGLHRDAAAIFDRLLAERTNLAVRNRTHFFLAKIRYQRGYFADALEALDAIEGQLDEDLEPERRMMYAQVLLALERFDEAADVLDRWRSPAEWYHFASYNLGIAYIRAGKVEQGAERLEEIGVRRGADRREFLSLQDKANVALGYAYLQNGRPVEAKEVLQRVRLQGPYSNKALLGVGWADSELKNYRRALVPWLELRGRDLLDSAVQESLLAIPYAYGKLGANREAANQYLAAIEAYVDETQRLDAAITRIESGDVVEALLAGDDDAEVGWFWQLQDVPNSDESRYLYYLLAEHEFQEALKNFRDLHALRQNLTRWRENVDIFDSMLSTRELAFEERLPRAEALLAKANLAELSARRAALVQRLDAIEAESDVVALAPRRDQRLWGELEELNETPALEIEIPESVEAQEKLRLLQGVLSWEMERHFAARVWNERDELRDVNRVLDQSRRLRERVTTALANEPQRFSGFAERVSALAPRIDDLLSRLGDLIRRQQLEVNRIAVGELEKRKSRLDTYTVQARFALASIYDKASKAESP